MGFFDDIWQKIFGGSKSEQNAEQTSRQSAQSTSQSQSSQTPTNMNPFTSALGGGLTTAFTDLLTNGLPNPTGPLAAPITPGESNVLGQLNAQTGPGTTRGNYLEDVLSGKFLGAGNPYLQKFIEAAQRPTLEGLTTALDRTLPGKFTQAGQFVTRDASGGSSPFDMAAALLSRSVGQTLGDIATKIAYPAYEAERTNQQQAVQLSQAEVDTTIKNLQAQALPRLIQEHGIERGLDVFKTRLAGLLDFLKTLGGVTSPVIGNAQQASASAQSTSSGVSHGVSHGESSSNQGLPFASIFPAPKPPA